MVRYIGSCRLFCQSLIWVCKLIAQCDCLAIGPWKSHIVLIYLAKKSSEFHRRGAQIAKTCLRYKGERTGASHAKRQGRLTTFSTSISSWTSCASFILLSRNLAQRVQLSHVNAIRSPQWGNPHTLQHKEAAVRLMDSELFGESEPLFFQYTSFSDGVTTPNVG